MSNASRVLLIVAALLFLLSAFGLGQLGQLGTASLGLAALAVGILLSAPWPLRTP